MGTAGSLPAPERTQPPLWSLGQASAAQPEGATAASAETSASWGCSTRVVPREITRLTSRKLPYNEQPVVNHLHSREVLLPKEENRSGSKPEHCWWGIALAWPCSKARQRIHSYLALKSMLLSQGPNPLFLIWELVSQVSACSVFKGSGQTEWHWVWCSFLGFSCPLPP